MAGVALIVGLVASAAYIADSDSIRHVIHKTIHVFHHPKRAKA